MLELLLLEARPLLDAASAGRFRERRRTRGVVTVHILPGDRSRSLAA